MMAPIMQASNNTLITSKGRTNWYFPIPISASPTFTGSSSTNGGTEKRAKP